MGKRFGRKCPWAWGHACIAFIMNAHQHQLLPGYEPDAPLHKMTELNSFNRRISRSLSFVFLENSKFEAISLPPFSANFGNKFGWDCSGLIKYDLHTHFCFDLVLNKHVPDTLHWIKEHTGQNHLKVVYFTLQYLALQRSLWLIPRMLYD